MATREEQLKAAQTALQASEFAKGLALAENLLAERRSDPEALYLAAVASRYLGKHSDAEKHLGALHQAMPEYGRAWQEEGHMALALGDKTKALEAFARATRFNPALTAS